MTDSQYIGIIDEVIRYQDITQKLVLTNADKVTNLTIKNESCNFYLFIIKHHKDGLLADKLKVAEIVLPGLFFSRSESHPYRLVNACYDFVYVPVPDEYALKDCEDKVETPFKQMSITIEKENCKK